MTCLYPRWAIYEHKKDGSWGINMTTIRDARTFQPDQSSVRPDGSHWIQIPCKQCINCRLQNSQTWASRCMLEAKKYNHNYFITLTYDNENLPTIKGINKETGEVGLVPNLRKTAIAEFMKKLRRHYQYHFNHEDIRYYGCGEYGSNYGRPHYHIIAFNLPINDLTFWYNDKKGSPIFQSKTLTKIWGKGIVAVTNVTWETCAYVARYCLKKQTGKNKVLYEQLNIQEEFSSRSTHPGIAREYFEQNKFKIYETDEIYLLQKGKATKIKPFSYYDKLFDVIDPDKMKQIKKERLKRGMQRMLNVLKNTDMSKLEYYEKQEALKMAQIKALKRNIERL